MLELSKLIKFNWLISKKMISHTINIKIQVQKEVIEIFQEIKLI